MPLSRFNITIIRQIGNNVKNKFFEVGRSANFLKTKVLLLDFDAQTQYLKVLFSIGKAT